MRRSVLNKPNILFPEKSWRYIDHTSVTSVQDPLQSFAVDDALCESIGRREHLPAVRAWVHPKTIVLGIQDSRLPSIGEGIDFLQNAGYHVIVRNSGGLAVVLDEGILNISLVIREDKSFSIDDGYERMVALAKRMFHDAPAPIIAEEVKGSYCPGSFDLSIHGLKFAGLSQRRKRGGVAIQIYLAMTKSGSERAELLRTFYEQAVQNQPTKYDWPRIRPETMASLSELYEKEITVADGLERLFTVMKTDGASLSNAELTSHEQSQFAAEWKQVRSRNDKAFTDASRTYSFS
ncbi:lipoate--protein ligase family protein [Salsuginibacillus kocurii]|uniref:lipoate--protein ligase family protein n=1 Tax=Salsuginibacillus kocurii TaxID=427078 RepID=UPI00058B5727|nr:lipoate--protein ligase family protein [Salsuginibacillus kocurii]